MKKLFIFVAALVMAACGSKTGSNASDVDSIAQDSVLTADAEADLKKAVEAQLQTIFSKLREMDASGNGINISELDKQFCSEEFLSLQKAVFEKSEKATSPEQAFSDEGWRWFPDISAAQTVDSVSVKLIGQDRAEAKFRLTDKRGFKAHQHLVMLLENGQWKIHNWIDAEAFPEGNYLDWMKHYLGVQEGEVMTAPEEDWTEEAVARQIEKYIDAVNKTFADDSDLSPFDLDKQYYTQYWNEVYGKVGEKDDKQTSVETCFFVDDNHWTAGLEAPLTVKNIKVELTTGDTAEASLTLQEKNGGFSQKVFLLLDYEKGQWRINDWPKKSHDTTGSILTEMERYIHSNKTASERKLSDYAE